MSTYVQITNGVYRNNSVNAIFPLVKDYTEGAKGNFVTVDANGVIPVNNATGHIRVKVDSMENITFVSADDFHAQNEGQDVSNPTVLPKKKAAKEPEETDEEVMARIASRFEILHEMTAATIQSEVRAMIVTGPPGVGKSFGIEAELEKAEVFERLRGHNVRKRFDTIKGASTPIGLYMALYNHRDKGDVLVFDDCDSILFDELSLNLLKAALDSGKKRTISWNTESNALDREGIPKKFDFKGSVIFITNLSFDHVRSKKIKDHLAALQSRCHYLDLTLDTERDKILRIKQIASTGELFSNYKLSVDVEHEIIDYMVENKDRLRELSLRMALKIADLAQMSSDRWKVLAESTCMRRKGVRV